MSLASCRNLQIEAKTHLKALYVAEESHRGEFDLYVKDFGKLGFRSFAEDPHYAIEVLEADDRHFRGRAVGNKGLVQGDVWEITDSNELVNTHDACAR